MKKKYFGIFLRKNEIDRLLQCSPTANKVFIALAMRKVTIGLDRFNCSGDYIASITGLSRITVNKVVQELVHKGIIVRRAFYFQKNDKVQGKSIYGLNLGEFA